MFDALQGEWAFARALSVDLLEACDDDALHATRPAQTPLWKILRHMGRVHENYLDGLTAGTMRFDAAAGSFVGPATKTGLLDYFAQLEARHGRVFARQSAATHVDWFGEAVAPDVVLMRLISHETLHHGQLLLIWRELARAFPPSWAAWGEA